MSAPTQVVGRFFQPGPHHGQLLRLPGDLSWDIVERKRAEEALRQTNETLRATLDAAPVAIFDMDTEGRVKSIWNPAAERMLGWRRDEVLGHFLPSVPEDSKEEFAGLRARVRSGKSIMGKDVVRRRKDASVIEYSIYAAPEYDDEGKVIGNILPSTIEIRRFLDPEVGPILADPTQMQQVVMNLCTNAAHAMRQKGGALEVRLTEMVTGREKGEEILKLAPGLYARLRVKDNGHGIPPEILDRIFDPYFSTKEMGEGTGLGLAVVEGIVRSHGGAITVESEPEIGPVFLTP